LRIKKTFDPEHAQEEPSATASSTEIIINSTNASGLRLRRASAGRPDASTGAIGQPVPENPLLFKKMLHAMMSYPQMVSVVFYGFVLQLLTMFFVAITCPLCYGVSLFDIMLSYLRAAMQGYPNDNGTGFFDNDNIIVNASDIARQTLNGNNILSSANNRSGLMLKGHETTEVDLDAEKSKNADFTHQLEEAKSLIAAQQQQLKKYETFVQWCFISLFCFVINFVVAPGETNGSSLIMYTSVQVVVLVLTAVFWPEKAHRDRKQSGNSSTSSQ